MPLGPGSCGARIHTSCADLSAPTFDRAFARWCLTVECDRLRRAGSGLRTGSLSAPKGQEAREEPGRGGDPERSEVR